MRCSLAFIALLFLNTVWSEKRYASAKGILSRDVYLVWCTMSPSLPSPPFSGNSACRVVYLARAHARGTCVKNESQLSSGPTRPNSVGQEAIDERGKILLNKNLPLLFPTRNSSKTASHFSFLFSSHYNYTFRIHVSGKI